MTLLATYRRDYSRVMERSRSRKILIALGLVLFALAVLLLTQSDLLTKPRFVQFSGVNISGAEITPTQVPGMHGTHYIYPDNSMIDYFATKGMNIIRLAVLWERLQHRQGVNLDDAEMQRIDAVIGYAGSKGMKVILDVHNFAEYLGAVIGTEKLPTAALADLWRQIATRYKDNATVIFGLMNEPKGLPTETWLQAANLSIAQIRQAGAQNLILVPGNGWSSARDWTSAIYGTPNADVMLKVVDPSKNIAFEVHQFFDQDFTGTRAECQNVDVGVGSLKQFTQWARKNGKRGFMGEFGVGENQQCLETLDRVLKYMSDNNDVWLGWTYWAAGSWWPKNYFTSVEPLDGKDRVQMTILEKYIGLAGSSRKDAK